jgi:predicted RNase H-like HicB family nuclease
MGVDEPKEEIKMDFHTAVLRRSGGYWVALCLENGLVGQGDTKDEAVQRLIEAIESFDDVRYEENDIYNAPLSIKELHEFLTVEGDDPVAEPYELRAVNA